MLWLDDGLMSSEESPLLAEQEELVQAPRKEDPPYTKEYHSEKENPESALRRKGRGQVDSLFSGTIIWGPMSREKGLVKVLLGDQNPEPARMSLCYYQGDSVSASKRAGPKSEGSSYEKKTTLMGEKEILSSAPTRLLSKRDSPQGGVLREKKKDPRNARQRPRPPTLQSTPQRKRTG